MRISAVDKLREMKGNYKLKKKDGTFFIVSQTSLNGSVVNRTFLTSFEYRDQITARCLIISTGLWHIIALVYGIDPSIVDLLFKAQCTVINWD